MTHHTPTVTIANHSEQEVDLAVLSNHAQLTSPPSAYTAPPPLHDWP